NLSAVNNIINAGTISSSANLAMTAGGSIVNSGTITAAQNINLVSALGNITNSGLISAIAGNINLATSSAQNILINNTNGSMEAMLGKIMASSASDILNSTLTVLGGNFKASEYLFEAKNGVVNVDVGNMVGKLNVNAGEVHVSAATPDLRLGSMCITGDPTFYNTSGDITIESDLIFNSASFTLNNLAIVASGNITTGSGAGQIDTSGSGVNAGSILMVAGANFTTSGTSPVPAGGQITSPPTGDSTSTLTITGASANGGSIDLTGGGNFPITSFNTSTNNGSGGSVTLVAFAGASSNTGGSVTLPSTVTINTGTSQNNSFTLNGNVTIIAGATGGQGISIGGINSSGNTVTTQAANGVVTIANATPLVMGNPTSSGSTVSGTAFAGASALTVSDPGDYQTNYYATINPYGSNAEQIVVSSVSGGQLQLNSNLQYTHNANEPIYFSAPTSANPSPAPANTALVQVVVQPNAGGVGNSNSFTGAPISNGIFAPGTLQNANMSITGAITAGANVNLSTGGQMNLQGNISLTQNPPSPTNYQIPPGFPAINIQANSLTVGANANINAQVSANPIQVYNQANVPNAVIINAPTITNNGNIAGSLISIRTTNLNNIGNISGNGNYNAYVDIESTAGNSLTVSGLGTITVPNAGAVVVSAADGQQLSFNGGQTFNLGNGSVLAIDAQAAGAGINIGNGAGLTIIGNSVISINTPTLTLGTNSVIDASNANPTDQAASSSSIIAISGGYTANPLNIGINSAATIKTGTAGFIRMRPIDGQNINFTGSGTLTISNATLATSTAGSVDLGTVTFSGSNNQTVQAPSGGIYGTAFEPYVGGIVPGAANYTLFGGYTFGQTLTLLSSVAASQQFQIVSTYNFGTTADPSAQNGYAPLGAAAFVIPTAKLLGLRVSAGVGIQPGGPGTALDLPGTQADINFTLQAAKQYGNVVELVVGNECLDPTSQATINLSLTNLSTDITYANTLMGTLGLTLPITTRQRHDLMSSQSFLQNTPAGGNPSLANIINNQLSGYIYANIYPYYDNLNLTAANFTSTVQQDMTTQYTGVYNAFQTAGVTTTDIRIGETGWAALPPTQPANLPAPPVMPSQATLQFAQMYYPAMQQWSATSKNLVTGNTGIIIADYFESFDEPWKVNSGPPSQNGEPYFGIWTATGSSSPSPYGGYTLASVQQKYPLPLYGSPTPIQSLNSQNAVPSAVTASSPTISPLLSNAVFNNIISSNSGTAGRGTILPTDINPEIKESNNQPTPFGGGSLAAAALSFAQIPLIVPGLSQNSNGEIYSANVNLPSGNAIFAPTQDMSINASLASVLIDAGSVAMILQNGDEMAIMALHDEHSSAVRVSVNGSQLDVPIGSMLVLSKNANAKFDELDLSNTVPFRRVNDHNLGGLKAYSAEFSLPSMLSDTRFLKRLQMSDKKEEQALAKKLMKNAAALTLLTKSKGAFTPPKAKN
ncbi:MAG: hypothetical protein K2X27_14295, partial [Candidatus Obscuribacterales bacterium]|nr:hypothetical protein [Candidatus Obscuribacterales bacterium]